MAKIKILFFKKYLKYMALLFLSRSTTNSLKRTIIGPSTTLCGSLCGEGELIIQGYVEGIIKIKGRLDISGEARVKASIDVEKVTS